MVLSDQDACKNHITMSGTQTKVFAFIDFHNTDGTTKKLHGFAIDWVKLYKFLKDK